MVKQCHECFGIFRTDEVFAPWCPLCEAKVTAQAEPGEVKDLPVNVEYVDVPGVGLHYRPKKPTWLTRLKAWASRYAAYLDALLLRLL